MIYVPTGQDDVFAVSVDTGEILWEYKAHLDQTISRRLLRLGEPRRRARRRQGLHRPARRHARRARPEDRPGRLEDAGRALAGRLLDHRARRSTSTAWSITGVSGGEFGIARQRHRLRRDDGQAEAGASTRSPARARPATTRGRRTTTRGSTAARRSGRRRRSIPKLGPALLLDRQRGPDNDGSARAGENLFTASIVALDVKTGKLKWYYQMVHHDIWDYDAPSPTILFDAEVDGKDVHGIGEAEKTGWLYLLDRETGKPLLPDPGDSRCRRTPTRRRAPTQPIPSLPAVRPARRLRRAVRRSRR